MGLELGDDMMPGLVSDSSDDLVSDSSDGESTPGLVSDSSDDDESPTRSHVEQGRKSAVERKKVGTTAYTHSQRPQGVLHQPVLVAGVGAIFPWPTPSAEPERLPLTSLG